MKLELLKRRVETETAFLALNQQPLPTARLNSCWTFCCRLLFLSHTLSDDFAMLPIPSVVSSCITL
eukprot:5742863-Amphidinium_carterae.1